MRVAPAIVLTGEERTELERLVQSGQTGARLVQRARIVLMAASGAQNKDIAAELDVGRVQVARWRERYMQFRLAGIERDLPRGAPAPPVDVPNLVRMTVESQPEAGAKWSTRTMAAALGISPASVSRHWRANGLSPQAGGGFAFPPDAGIVATLEDIAGLHLAPDAHTLVLCGRAAASTISAHAAQPPAPVRTTQPAVQPPPKVRSAITDFLAALGRLEREGLQSPPEKDHGHLECLRFLRRVERASGPEMALHLISDKPESYQHPGVQKWLDKHTRFHMHFTPVAVSWLKSVERFLVDNGDQLTHDALPNLPRLTAAIDAHAALPAARRSVLMWTPNARHASHKAARASIGIQGRTVTTASGEEPLDTRTRPSFNARLSGDGHSLREHVTNLKRDRILLEAAQLFFERGYLQTSVDAIAERLGATKPFVYYHFESKVDILVEICERSNRDALAAADNAMSAKGSPSARFEQFLRDFTNIALEQHQLVAIYFREELSLPAEATERINQMRKTINLRLNALLSEGINSGDFQIEDPRMGALVIAGMSSYAFAWYRERGRLNQAEVTERIVKMALKLVSAAPYHRPAYRVHSVTGA